MNSFATCGHPTDSPFSNIVITLVCWCGCALQVTPSELAQIMRGLGDKLSDEEIELLVKVADKDGDGTISIQEWATITFFYPFSGRAYSFYHQKRERILNKTFVGSIVTRKRWRDGPSASKNEQQQKRLWHTRYIWKSILSMSTTKTSIYTRYIWKLILSVFWIYCLSPKTSNCIQYPGLRTVHRFVTNNVNVVCKDICSYFFAWMHGTGHQHPRVRNRKIFKTLSL